MGVVEFKPFLGDGVLAEGGVVAAVERAVVITDAVEVVDVPLVLYLAGKDLALVYLALTFTERLGFRRR